MAEHTGTHVTTYYVHGENGDDDANDGTSLLASWQTIQKAFDEIAAGNIVDGDEVRILKTSDDATHYGISAKLTCTWSGREVLITGANSSGVVDGTVVTINGDGLDGSTPMMEISVAVADNVIFANLKFDADDTAQHCVEATSANSHNLYWANCQFTQATSHGVYTNNLAMYWQFVNCRFDNNGGDGANHSSSNYGVYYKCLFDNNAADGGRMGQAAKVVECVFFNNGNEGMYISNNGATVFSCVFDNNASDGVYISGANQSMFVDCLFTNNTAYGIVVGSGAENRHFNSAFYNNGTDSFYESGTKHLTMHNYLDDVTTTYDDASNFDFTHNSGSSVVGAGMPTHYKWFGSTASDIGLGKFRAEGGESISIF